MVKGESVDQTTLSILCKSYLKKAGFLKTTLRLVKLQTPDNRWESPVRGKPEHAARSAEGGLGKMRHS